MQILENRLYHIYNQGNNRGRIYFKSENYLFFLNKFKKYVLPNCKVLSYCLMPNHFHFLIFTTKGSIQKKKVGSLEVSTIMDGFRLLLSSYAQAINKQEGRSGSLFRQKTKLKLLDNNDKYYPFTCFQYIHQNPLRAGIVEKMEEWEYSSFQDYMGRNSESICDQQLAFDLLGINRDEESFYRESYQVILKKKIDELF